MKAFFQIKSHLKFPEFFERKNIILAQGALPFEDRFAEAQGKGFSALSLKSAPRGRPFNLYPGNMYP